MIDGTFLGDARKNPIWYRPPKGIGDVDTIIPGSRYPNQSPYSAVNHAVRMF